MNDDGRSVLDDVEKETTPGPGGEEPASHPRQENVDVGPEALASLLGEIEPLLGEALAMVPDALARAYKDPRFRLAAEEKAAGQRIVGITLKLYVDDLLKYAKVLALVASVAWAASVAIPRFSLMGRLKRARMQAKRRDGEGPEGEGMEDGRE